MDTLLHYWRAWRFQWLAALVIGCLALLLLLPAGADIALPLSALVASGAFWTAAFIQMAADW